MVKSDGGGPYEWRRILAAATREAVRRGDHRLGTDHLLLGLLDEPAGLAALSLETDVEVARRALDALDRDALAAVGVRLEVAHETPPPATTRRRPVLSSGARTVLVRALALRSRVRALGPEHVLLALLDTELPDPAAQLLAALGGDRERARERLRREGARLAM